MPDYTDHVCNPELLKLAGVRARAARLAQGGRQKSAFVPGGDPSMGGGGGDPAAAAAGGGDPAAGGMPMDPAMMGGGGAPPPESGGGGDMSGIGAKLDQLIQLMQAGGGGMGGGAGGAGAGAGMLKPKIDVNVEIMKLNKMVARIADQLGVHIPAHEMVATPQDLMNMAGQQNAAPQGGAPQDPMAGGAIGQMQGMQGMEGSGAPAPPKQATARPYHERGEACSVGLTELTNKAAAVHRLLQSRRGK